VNGKQNCYNAKKVLSFVAPSGEQELTQSYEGMMMAMCRLFNVVTNWMEHSFFHWRTTGTS